MIRMQMISSSYQKIVSAIFINCMKNVSYISMVIEPRAIYLRWHDAL